MIRVADYIMDRLVAEGIRHIFMITGRGVLYLSDAVARQEELSGISVHHEQAASFAASAYAACRESMGACLVSTGCASTNAITGLLCAWQDAVPCIFISGQNMLQETVRYSGKKIRTFGQQEADIIEVVKPLTKYASMITNAKDIAYEMDKAIYSAQEGRKGPVWIDVPLDIQNMRIEPGELRRYEKSVEAPVCPDKEDMAYVANCLNEAKRPIILLGSGVRAAGAVETLYKFIEEYPVPVVFDAAAADIYGLDNKWSIGVIGTPGGSRAGNFAVQNADLIVSVGCRLSPMTTGPEYHKFGRAAKLLVVDIDREEHAKETVRIDRFIYSDAKIFLEQLIKYEKKDTEKDWLSKCLHWKKIFPKCEQKYKESELVDLYYLADCLSKVLTEDSIFLCDAGIEELICPSTIAFKKGQRCIHPVSQGAMGYALPASIGAYYAGGKKVVAVIGDGSIMMNLQELQTIRYRNLPVIILVTNNNCYSVINKRQKELFRKRTIGTNEADGVNCPSFEKVASAFEIPYKKINGTAELENGLEQLMRMDGPVICEVMCVENQEYISNGYAKTQERKYVQRPIEDQAPFMDRRIFAEEMVIEPIDM